LLLKFEGGFKVDEILKEPVMLNPFGFAQAKLREASHSFNWRVLLSKNEILRHYVPQNDIGQEYVISREP